MLGTLVYQITKPKSFPTKYLISPVLHQYLHLARLLSRQNCCDNCLHVIIIHAECLEPGWLLFKHYVLSFLFLTHCQIPYGFLLETPENGVTVLREVILYVETQEGDLLHKAPLI